MAVLNPRCYRCYNRVVVVIHLKRLAEAAGPIIYFYYYYYYHYYYYYYYYCYYYYYFTIMSYRENTVHSSQ